VKVQLAEYNRKQKKHDGQQHGQPERGSGHQSGGGAHVRVAEYFRVEDENEHEVEDHTAPDDEVIESGPIRHFQGTLPHAQNKSFNSLIHIRLR